MTSFRPSTADSTEIAGVMTASPRNMAAPMTPSRNTSAVRRPERARGERGQRQRSALAVVVGAQQQQHVFDRDHDDQRPQDQRQHAEHDVAGDRAGSPPPPPPRGTRRAGSCRYRRRRRRRCRAPAPTAPDRSLDARSISRIGHVGRGLVVRCVSHGGQDQSAAATRGGAPYITAHQRATCSAAALGSPGAWIFGGGRRRPASARRLGSQAAMFPYSSLSSPSRA